MCIPLAPWERIYEPPRTFKMTAISFQLFGFFLKNDRWPVYMWLKMCEKFGNDSYSGSLDRERKRTASGGGGVGSETIVSHETEFRGDTNSAGRLNIRYTVWVKKNRTLTLSANHIMNKKRHHHVFGIIGKTILCSVVLWNFEIIS